MSGLLKPDKPFTMSTAFYPLNEKHIATLNRYSDTGPVFAITIPIEYFIPGTQYSLCTLNMKTDHVKYIQQSISLLTTLLDMCEHIWRESNAEEGIPSIFKKKAFLEVCPSRHGQHIIAGYRLWFFIGEPNFNIGSCTQILINSLGAYMKHVGRLQANSKDNTNGKPGYQISIDAPDKTISNEENAHHKRTERFVKSYTTLNSIHKLVDMFSILNGCDYKRKIDIINSKQLDDPTNPLYIDRMFSPLSAVNIDHTNISSTCTDPSAYFHVANDDAVTNCKFSDFKFPHPNNVYELSSYQYKPKHLFFMLLPSVMYEGWPELGGDQVRDKYANTTPMRNPTTVCVHEQNLGTAHEAHVSVFGMHPITNNVNQRDYIINHHAQQRKECEQEFANARANLMSVDPHNKQAMQIVLDQHIQRMTQFRTNALDLFQRAVWNKFSTFIPDNLKVVIDWGEQFKLGNSYSLCYETNKITSNMSLWSDWLIQMCISAEMVEKAATCHHTLLVAWLAAQNASDPDRENKLHYLAYGPAATSKSFIISLVQRFCIPKTCISYTYKTTKADAVNGNQDGLVEIFHEMPADALGAANVAQSGGCNQTENMFKSRLTSGLVSLRTVNIGENGERNQIEVSNLCNGTFLANTNAKRSDIHDEMADRFFMTSLNPCPRQGRPLPFVLCSESLQRGKGLKNARVEHMRWVNYMVRLVFCLIEYNVLTLSTPQSDMVLPLILAQAKVLGMPKSDALRHLQRVRCGIRTAVVVRAILLRFGSRLSPFHGEQFDWSQLLSLQSDLVDHDVSLPITILGLLKEQYEPELDTSVVEAMCEALFINPTTTKVDDQSVVTYSLAPKGVNTMDGMFTIPKATSTKGKAKDQPRGGNTVHNMSWDSIKKAISNGNHEVVDINSPYHDLYWVKTGFFNGTQGDITKVWNSRQALTNHLTPLISPSPQRDDVYTTIRRFEAQNMNSIRGEGGGGIESQAPSGESSGATAAIVYADKSVYVLKAFIQSYLENRTSKLEAAIKHVVQHSYTQPQCVVFGAGRVNSTPYQLQELYLKPNKTILPSFPNSNYFSPNMINAMQASCPRYEAKGGNVHMSYTGSKEYTVDMCPSEWIFTDHRNHCGISAADCVKWNSMPEVKSKERLCALYDKPLPAYPNIVQDTDPTESMSDSTGQPINEAPGSFFSVKQCKVANVKGVKRSRV
jgi:hypothetical protein